MESEASSSSLSCSIIPVSCIFHSHLQASFGCLWGLLTEKLVFVPYLSFVSTIFKMHLENYFSNSFITYQNFINILVNFYVDWLLELHWEVFISDSFNIESIFWLLNFVDLFLFINEFISYFFLVLRFIKLGYIANLYRFEQKLFDLIWWFRKFSIYFFLVSVAYVVIVFDSTNIFTSYNSWFLLVNQPLRGFFNNFLPD